MVNYINVKRLVFLIISIIAIGCQDENYDAISMIQLIAKPANYNGSHVVVKGFFQLGLEKQALYFSREHAGYILPENAFWIETKEDTLMRPAIGIEVNDVDLGYFNNKYVLIEGRFSSTETGHMGAYAGSVLDIDRILELNHYINRTIEPK